MIDYYTATEGAIGYDISSEVERLSHKTPQDAIEALTEWFEEPPLSVYVHGWQRKHYEMTPQAAAETLIDAMEDEVEGPDFGDPEDYGCTIGDDEREVAIGELRAFFEAHPDVLKRASASFTVWAYEVVSTERWVLIDGEYRRGTP